MSLLLITRQTKMITLFAFSNEIHANVVFLFLNKVLNFKSIF